MESAGNEACLVAFSALAPPLERSGPMTRRRVRALAVVPSALSVAGCQEPTAVRRGAIRECFSG